MIRFVTLSAAIVLTFVALGTAAADPATTAGPGSTIGPDADPSPAWATRDWILAPLSGTAAGAGLALGFGYAGYQVDGDCFDPGSDCVPAVSAASIYTGLIFGTSSGVYLYGDRRGFNGSFRAALLGAVIGNVGSGLPIALAARLLGDELGPPVALASIVVFPAIGATIAYRISDRRAQRDRPTSGALVDVQNGAASLSIPAVSLGLKDGGLSVYAPVVAGTF